jgi:putative phosphoesterase
MKIGLISDTHTPGAALEPPYEVAKAFEGVDLILHAGDIYVASCLDWLEQIAPVLAVEYRGPNPLNDDPRVVEQRITEQEGYTIGVVHDFMIPGVKAEIFPGVIDREFPLDASLPDAVQKVFGTHLDVVVFGHTHTAIVEDHQGILFVNPGSPSLPNQMRRLGSVGILELTPEGRCAQIIKLSDFSEPGRSPGAGRIF